MNSIHTPTPKTARYGGEFENNQTKNKKMPHDKNRGALFF